MLINAGITKLQNAGWFVSKKSDWSYQATKGDGVIDIACTSSPVSGYEMGNMSVYSNTLVRTKVYNLTNAMKTLNDIPHVPRSTGTTPSARASASATLTKGDIAREFVNYPADYNSNVVGFPQAKISALNIHSLKDIDDLFALTFIHELLDKKKYSRKSDEIKSKIRSRKDKLWKIVVDNFQREHPDIPPLRKVEVTTSVPDFDEYLNQSAYYHTRNSVSTTTAVFAFTADEASNYVNAVTGGFANVKDMGIFAVGEKAESLHAYQQTSPIRAQQSELLKLERAKTSLTNAQKQLTTATRDFDLCEKKVEFATFLDNLASQAVEGSSMSDEEIIEE